jgi:putative membrane protein
MRRPLLATFVTLLVVLASAVVASAATHAGVSAQDANYLQTSISGDRFEIIGGKMALRKQASAEVRILARRLIKDHSKSLSESIGEAKKYGIEIPKAPTPSEVWELQTVAGLNGLSFDHAYSYLEVKDHQQDIEETTFEAVHGGNGEIKQSARKELPMLRLHLSLSKRAMATV